MHIILFGLRIKRPRRATKHTQPVIWILARWSRVAPEIPVALRVVMRTPRLGEPGMLFGSMVRNKINNYAQVQAMRFCDQPIKGLQITEDWIDSYIVGYIVPE